MSYPAYGEYKPAVAEWVAEIPAHWEEWKVSHGFGLIGSGTTPKSDSSVYYGGDTLWVTTAELRESVIQETSNHVTEEALAEHSALRKYPSGSVVMAMYGATIGRLGVLGAPATVNQACCVFALPEKFHPRFFYYWLWMRRPILISLSSGGGQPNLNQEDLKRLRVPIPAIHQQEQITVFLDWKANQIDSLIAKKQELLQKLKEKRLAVITQAVTKGLNPDAPMRDSGIAWLGKVPAHWEVKRLKFVAHIGNGSTPNREEPLYWNDGSYPWLNSAVVNQEAVTSSDQFVTPMALAECHLPRIQPPAVLVGITGQGKTRGMATTLLFEATINQHLAYVKPDDTKAVVGYLRRVFDMAYLHLRSESENGGSTKGAITCEQIAELPIPVPLLAEQEGIANWAEASVSKIERMADNTQSAITRLTEYRTALITAATTGKIDVRHVKIPVSD